MAGDVIDSLSIELNSNATKANKAVDELISKLGNLANSLTRIDGSGLNGIANGVGKLGNSMQSMKGIGEAKFQNLANGINKLSAINTAGLNKSASALYQITKSFGEIGKIGENTKQIASLTTDLSKLGNKGISNAITNIPQLATAMKNLMTTLSTAPKVSNNLIKMTNAMANLASQGQKVSGATKGLTSTFKSYDSSATSSTSKTAKLSSMIGKMYQSFFYVKRGISGIKDAVKSSMDYIETLNYFDAAFGQVADTAVKDWKDAGYKSAEQYYNSFSERAKKLTSQMSGYNISPTGSLEATGKASLGIDPNQLMNYQATFAQMSSSIGMTGEQSVKLSRVLTEIGADLASVKNMDFKKTWNDMASGLAGMSRTLDKYGVNIRNVNLQQKLSDIGIQANIQNLNQNEKALLRTIILLNSTKYAYGDLAETINQPANQVRLLQANFQNLSRTIGNLFLPVVAKILPYINGLTIALQRLFAYVGKKLGLDISSLTSSVGDSSFDMSELADNTDDVAGGLDDASKKAKKLKNNINTIGIDKLNIISKDKDKTDKDDNKGLNNSDLAKLNKAFEDAYEKYQKAWDKAFAGVDNKALEIADKITNAFKKGDYKGIGTYISDNLTKALKSINWDSIYEGAAKFGTGLAEFLNGLITPELFYEVGKTIAKFLGTRIQFALNFFQEFDWSNLGESLANGINGFFENYPFEDMANALNKFVDGLEKALFSFIKNVNWWHVFNGLWDFFTNLEIDTLLVIPMLRAFMKIRKNAGSTFKALQAIGSTSLKKLSKGFSFLSENIKVLGGKDGIAYTFMEARDSMSKTTKVMMGAGGILAAFAGVKNATKGMANGTKSVVAGLGQIALSAGVAGAALYTAFGPWGLAVGAIAGVIGAIAGIAQGIDDINRKEIALKFSDESGLKISELNDGLEKSLSNIRELPKAFKDNSEEMKTASEDVGSALDDLTAIGAAIKNSEGTSIASAENIANAFKKLEQSSQEYLDNAYANTVLSLEMNREVLENQGINVDEAIKKASKAYEKDSAELKQAIKVQRETIGTKGTNSKEYLEATKTIAKLTGQNSKELADSSEKLSKAKKELNKNKINLSDYFDNDNKLDEEGLKNAFGDAKSIYEKQLNSLNTYWDEQIKLGEEKGWDKKIIDAYKKQKKLDAKELKTTFNKNYTEPLQKALNNSFVDAVSGIDTNNTSSAVEFERRAFRVADDVYNPLVNAFNSTFSELGIEIQNLDDDTIRNLFDGLRVTDESDIIFQLKENYQSVLIGMLKNISLTKGAELLKTELNTTLFAAINGLSIEEARTEIAKKFESLFSMDFKMNLGMKVETPADSVTGDWFSGEQKAFYLNNDQKVKDWAKKNGTIKFNRQITFSTNPLNATGLENGLKSAELFYANENGYSELIGRVGNNTAVANSDQIMTMVSNGVAKAVSDVLVPVLAGGGNGNTQRIEIPVIIDGREITRIVNKNNSRNGAKIMGNETGYVYG